MMKKATLWTVVLALVVAQTALAQDQGQQGNRGGRRKRAGGWLMRMDKDGDGKISKAEFRGPERKFDDMDANHDGFVDETEVKECIKRHMEKQKAEWDALDKDAIFAEIDGDGDGVITKDEFKAADLGRIVNGALRKARMAARGMDGKGGGILKRLDKDGDGKLSADELPRGKQMLDKLDKNGDGFIDADELKAGRHNRRGPGGQGPQAQAPAQ